MFAHRRFDRGRAEAGPTAPSTAYRAPASATPGPRPEPRPACDVEAGIALALLALGCAPRVLAALARREVFAAEATLCALSLAFALAASLRWAGGLLAARARPPRAPVARGAPAPDATDHQ